MYFNHTGGQGAETSGGQIVEEDSWFSPFSPSKPLGYEGKLLAGEGMEGMGNCKDKLPIPVIGCS